MPKAQADEDIIAGMIETELEKRAQAVAGAMGPPPGQENVTGQKELAMWNQRDPNVDIMAAYQQARAQGMDDLDARSAATVKAYPHRGRMLLAAGTTPDERIAYARRMRRLSEKGGGDR